VVQCLEAPQEECAARAEKAFAEQAVDVLKWELSEDRKAAIPTNRGRACSRNSTPRSHLLLASRTKEHS